MAWTSRTIGLTSIARARAVSIACQTWTAKFRNWRKSPAVRMLWSASRLRSATNGVFANLEAAEIPARQLSPAKVKAFGKIRGTLAKTDRIDAALIARFMAFRPETGRRLLRGRRRDLWTRATARRQVVDIRKSVLQQKKAILKNVTADPVQRVSRAAGAPDRGGRSEDRKPPRDQRRLGRDGRLNPQARPQHLE